MCYTTERAITFHFWIKMKYPKMDEQKHPFMDEIGYVLILPKKDGKNLPLVDDLIIIKKWMNENIQ